MDKNLYPDHWTVPFTAQITCICILISFFIIIENGVLYYIMLFFKTPTYCIRYDLTVQGYIYNLIQC